MTIIVMMISVTKIITAKLIYLLLIFHYVNLLINTYFFPADRWIIIRILVLGERLIHTVLLELMFLYCLS
jgi:hypothetical protein